MIFWDTVLPKGNPFWSQHKPGDRWGCQCSLEATDEPATPIPSGTDRDDPAPGLDNNPAQDGKLFSDSHPYYPSSCGNCPFKTDGSAPSTPTNKAKDCTSCQYYINCVTHIGCIPDKEYGDRLLVSNNADSTEVKDNIRAAKALLDSFPDMSIRINEHILRKGHSNPEYLINGLVADRKGVMSANGITAGFKSAIGQGCRAIVIDLDKNMSDGRFRAQDIAKTISWRKRDFDDGIIEKCYVIFNGKAITITAESIERNVILAELKKIKP